MNTSQALFAATTAILLASPVFAQNAVQDKVEQAARTAQLQKQEQEQETVEEAKLSSFMYLDLLTENWKGQFTPRGDKAVKALYTLRDDTSEELRKAFTKATTVQTVDEEANRIFANYTNQVGALIKHYPLPDDVQIPVAVCGYCGQPVNALQAATVADRARPHNYAAEEQQAYNNGVIAETVFETPVVQCPYCLQKTSLGKPATACQVCKKALTTDELHLHHCQKPQK